MGGVLKGDWGVACLVMGVALWVVEQDEEQEVEFCDR